MNTNLIERLAYLAENDGLDAEQFMDWCIDHLQERGPWSRYDDEQSKLSSLLRVKVSQLTDADTSHAIRKKLDGDDPEDVWLHIVRHEVLPHIKAEVEGYGG